MKKEKYTLFVEHNDIVMVKEIELTLSQFLAQLNYFYTMLDETSDDETPFECRKEIYNTKYYCKLSLFGKSGNCTTVLSRFTAKDGYVFK